MNSIAKNNETYEIDPKAEIEKVKNSKAAVEMLGLAGKPEKRTLTDTCHGPISAV